ncbi:MAG: hypothetical protein H7230_03340 [Candidatus Parcubacteria bacterium]|nr:hypothetical protein [Candidatus Paceibacterota bacterium]
MNSNYRPTGNPSVRRSVDGFVSAPNRSNSTGQASTYRGGPSNTSQPQYSQPQFHKPQPSPYPSYNQGPQSTRNQPYRQPQTTPGTPTPRLNPGQSNNQFASINSYQPRQPTSNQYQPGSTQPNAYNHIPESAPKIVPIDPSSSLNSSIFPQNAQFYTNGYRAQPSPSLSESGPEPSYFSQPAPQLVSKPTQSQPHQSYGYSNGFQPPSPQHGQQVNQSVSSSTIAGAVLSSSTSIPSSSNAASSSSISHNYNSPTEDLDNQNQSSAIQQINQVRGNPQNSKFFPSTGTASKIRPIPNTIKYNSWFSLEWIVGVFKSFFGNSYKD